MKDNNLELGKDFIIIPTTTPYKDLNFKEYSMLGFILSFFTDSNTNNIRKNIALSKKLLKRIFNYGTTLIVAKILASLKEKGYLDYNSSQNKETVFTLMPKGLEVYNAIYKPIYGTSNNT